MEKRARARYNRGLDLVVLSEFSLNDMKQPLARQALTLDSPGFVYFQKLARAHHTYLVIPSVITAGGKYYNSAVLLDRQGAMLGRYDKAHPVPDEPPAETFEGGLTPGIVSRCSTATSGGLGLQICFDYMHEEGARAGHAGGRNRRLADAVAERDGGGGAGGQQQRFLTRFEHLAKRRRGHRADRPPGGGVAADARKVSPQEESSP